MGEGNKENKVIDFIVFKLEKLLNEVDDPAEVEIILGILDGYFLEQLAVGWAEGFPKILPLRDKSGTHMPALPPGYGAVGYDGYGKRIAVESKEQGE